MFDPQFVDAHMCHTCRHAIGAEESDALQCTLRSQFASGHACGEYEREAGADMPEPDDRPAVIYPLPFVRAPGVAREEKGGRRVLRNR
jgi:hypothetical protein